MKQNVLEKQRAKFINKVKDFLNEFSNILYN